MLETGEPLSSVGALFSANAYLGVEAMLPALASGADIVLTGRVADPSLFARAADASISAGTLDDADRLARGTVVGHLLECAGQLTGGYFADPGKKDVPGMAHLGFPFADVDADGNARLSKVDGHRRRASTRMTATEQLLYEVTDPHGVPDAGRHRGFLAVTLDRGRPRPRRRTGAARAAASGPTAQGQRRLSRRLCRRRRDRLCGRELRRARAARRRDRARAAARASSRNCAST